MEYWSAVLIFKRQSALIPLLQYSITPFSLMVSILYIAAAYDSFF